MKWKKLQLSTDVRQIARETTLPVGPWKATPGRPQVPEREALEICAEWLEMRVLPLLPFTLIYKKWRKLGGKGP